ncbi:hypothetical protein HI914_03135 [Erysiphe necator]|nr:hypothetical protein HI914_03135 [Erysiphe necator]
MSSQLKSDLTSSKNGIGSMSRGDDNLANPRLQDQSLSNIQSIKTQEIQPRFAHIYAEESDEGSHSWYGKMIGSLGSCIGTLGAIPCCFLFPNPYKSVPQGNVGLVTRFGKFHHAVDPGLIKVNPLSEHLIEVDVKIQIVEVPQQVCMTKDNVTVHLTSVIYYNITSPHKAAFGITNVRQALIERTQTTLRHVVGARVLQDLIERREELAQSIEDIIEDVALGWGVHVESMLIKDIIFSNELQDSLSMAAQSKRIGESKIIAARAEVESAKLMRQAADILSSAPAMQIRYLEAMQAMAKTANSKVIFLPGSSTLGIQEQLNAAPKINHSVLAADENLLSNLRDDLRQVNDAFSLENI